MNDTFMTIVGNVVDAPRMRLTKSGHAVTNFRVASTSRRFDREHQRWIDNATLFVNVTCWRAMAENVAFSVHKGQPVVVTGRYYSREYELNETVRVSYELEANAVGHDLTRGTSEFRKVIRPSVTVNVEVDDDGIPADRSDEWLDLAEQGVPLDEPAAASDADERALASVS
ncbi:MAG: single-strand DNA-binding protein [Pseudonocardiales bacterium]|jgi:single-strand DNA-binding protein|nr:single-strand binding protein [Pseudonocardiales bacterium]MDT4962626.1 single-strand DNA-binding protein [Pseudonocardiales bacterium]MDT4970009.1 single-strand DNA-binding protein [Pseudonocardiales bacterium]MDT4980553.1 single-strand DNA-binding protein [Pseudonocardiales bacterium]